MKKINIRMMGSILTLAFLGLMLATCISANSVENGTSNLTVNSCGEATGTFEIIALTQIWLEPGARETEVFVGSDEVGVSVWEDQKQSCWLEERRLDIFVSTDSEEDFDICGCFLLANGETFNLTLSSVNVTAVREE